MTSEAIPINFLSLRQTPDVSAFAVAMVGAFVVAVKVFVVPDGAVPHDVQKEAADSGINRSS